jgi:hypothetical protein
MSFGGEKKKTLGVIIPENGIPILNEPSWDQLVDLTFYLASLSWRKELKNKSEQT